MYEPQAVRFAIGCTCSLNAIGAKIDAHGLHPLSGERGGVPSSTAANIQHVLGMTVEDPFRQGLNEANSLRFIPRTIQCVVRRSVEPGDKPIGIAFPQITYHYS